MGIAVKGKFSVICINSYPPPIFRQIPHRMGFIKCTTLASMPLLANALYAMASEDIPNTYGCNGLIRCRNAPSIVIQATKDLGERVAQVAGRVRDNEYGCDFCRLLVAP